MLRGGAFAMHWYRDGSDDVVAFFTGKGLPGFRSVDRKRKLKDRAHRKRVRAQKRRDRA